MGNEVNLKPGYCQDCMQVRKGYCGCNSGGY